MKQRTQKHTPRRKQTPDFPIWVTTLSHDGRGLVRWGEQMLFIDGALPNELVTVRVTKKSSKIAEGVAKEILIPSSARGQPDCPHADICGGCTLQHLPHESQIDHKSNSLDELLTREGVVLDQVTRLPPLLGPTLGYRRRARLGVRWVQAKGRVLVSFRERGSNFIADIDGCPVLDPRIGQSLDKLETTIAAQSAPDRIPQVEVAAGDDTVAVVIRHLEPLSAADRVHWIHLAKNTGWHVYSQAKGPDTVARLWPADGPERLTYRIGEFGLEYQFAVTDFSQINAAVNRAMIIQAMELLDLRGSERVLDLFCGFGNFTLAAATRSREVIGVEVSEKMVDRVLQNANHNSLNNIKATAFDLTQSIAEQSWAKESWDTLIVDPPRSGAKEVFEELPLKDIKRMLYVSCNPATLARDAKLLIERGFKMTHLGIMDMFPHTAHIESMALFVKRGARG